MSDIQIQFSKTALNCIKINNKLLNTQNKYGQ